MLIYISRSYVPFRVELEEAASEHPAIPDDVLGWARFFSEVNLTVS